MTLIEFDRYLDRICARFSGLDVVMWNVGQNCLVYYADVKTAIENQGLTMPISPKCRLLPSKSGWQNQGISSPPPWITSSSARLIF